MRSAVHGGSIFEVEVANIDAFGFWLLVGGTEYFLPYEEYPWFRNARVRDILNVTLEGKDHLRWPALDVDLSIESLEHPESYPLIYKSRPADPKRRRRGK